MTTTDHRRVIRRGRSVLAAAAALAGVMAVALGVIMATGRWAVFPGIDLPGFRVEKTPTGESVIWEGDRVGRTADGSAYAPYPETQFHRAECDLRPRREAVADPGSWSAPSISATAPVVTPRGLDRSDGTGEFRLPDAPLGIRVPGSADLGDHSGTVLEAGHVDDIHGTLSPWGRLARLKPCDRLYRTDESGNAHEFVVTDLYAVPQERLVGEPIFRRDGPHRLALVTCAGRFVSGAGSTLGFSFSENLVVLAVPAAQGSAGRTSGVPNPHPRKLST